MGLLTTIIVLAVGITISSTMVWLEHRAKKVLSRRPIPTTPILMIGIVIALAAAVHLLTFLAKH